MSLIEIRPPQSVAEYTIACAMVERVYGAEGYLREDRATTHPGALLIAVRNGQLLGSIGVACGDIGSLPTERAFGFSASLTDECQRQELFEGSRLAIIDRSNTSILKGLIAGVILHAVNVAHHRTWWMTVKPTVALVLRRYCHLNYEEFPMSPTINAIEANPGYWGSSPAPMAIRISQENSDAALARLMVELEGKVEFNLSTFDHHLHYGCENTYSDRCLPAALAC